MELSKLRKKFFKVFIVLSISFPLSMSCFLSAQEQNKCLTMEQIVKLLEKDVEQEIIIENVKKYGSDLKMNTETISKLVRAGASDQLLKVIENHPCTALSITFPENGTECGSATKIEGTSKKFSGKFLWVFAHVKYLTNKWWPQVGAVKVADDGKWETMAYLGGSQDVGFDFEITAIWVDESTNQMLSNYLNRGDQTGHYPPMQLPKGSPSATVILKKTKH